MAFRTETRTGPPLLAGPKVFMPFYALHVLSRVRIDAQDISRIDEEGE